MKKYAPLLIGCFYSFSAFSFEISSKIQEGALIYGYLNKGEKLLIGSTEIIPTKEGKFFFGLPQDSTKLNLTLIHSNGEKETKTFSVEKRKWKEEIVTGLQPEKVTPSNKIFIRLVLKEKTTNIIIGKYKKFISWSSTILTNILAKCII